MRRRLWLAGGILLVLVAVAVLVPVPTPLELREWARQAGPPALVLFVVAHALITVTPFPRTAFTLAASLVFGPWTALAVCVAASTVSAAIAFAGARRLGGHAVERLGPERVRRVQERLSHRGLLTVVSARLIPAIPFAPLNYLLGVTDVAWGSYLLGTVVGLVPGTVAVVLLGDALSGHTSPALLTAAGISSTIGLIGVLLAARPERRRARGAGIRE